MELIRFKKVSVYVLNQEEPVLQDLELTIRSGEWVAVVGRTGSGKSVLGKLLAGVEGSYTGEIERPSRRTDVIAVMQNPEAQLIGQTVWEEVTFGLENEGLPKGEMDIRAADALEIVGLAGFGSRLVHHLSGGQKQLLAIASVVALKPSVLIADEVTSMLDPASRKRVIHVLQELNRGGTAIVYITQLLEELAYANRVVAVHKGKIGYSGSTGDFFYGSVHTAKGTSPCEEIGLIPPYTVRLVHALRKRGMEIAGSPIIPEDFIEERL